MDSRSYKDRVTTLEEQVKSLNNVTRQFQLWQNIVQKLVLEKFGIDIKNEIALALSESGLDGANSKTEILRLHKSNTATAGKRSFDSSTNPVTEVLKFAKSKKRLRISSVKEGNNVINVTSKVGIKKHSIERAKTGVQHLGDRIIANHVENNCEIEVYQKEHCMKIGNGIPIESNSINLQNTDKAIQMECEESINNLLNSVLSSENAVCCLEVPVSPKITENQKRFSTSSPEKFSDCMDTSFQTSLQTSIASVENTVTGQTNDISFSSRPPVIVSNSSEPNMFLMSTSECGVPKIVQYQLPGISSATGTSSCGSETVSTGQIPRLNILRKRKSKNKNSPLKVANSKTADVDEDGWHKWDPVIEAFKFIGMGPRTESSDEDTNSRSEFEQRYNYLTESQTDITVTEHRVVDCLTKSSENSPADQSDMQARDESTMNASEISETASSIRSHIDNDSDMENTNLHLKRETIDIDTVDLDSDYSDDTREIYSDNTLKDHVDSNEMLNTEDSSDISQDVPSVESIDNSEDSEEAKQQKIELFKDENFVNKALRTHGFRTKLLVTAMLNWKKALPEQDKEAVDIKRKAAKKVIVMDNEKKIYTCTHCPARLTNSYNRALEHAQKHFVKRSYKCGICDYKSSCKTTFVDHYKNPEYLNCFTTVACDIYDKNDFLLIPKSSLYSKRSKYKTKVDLNELKNCRKLKCQTIVKIMRCSQTDRFVRQYADLSARLQAISGKMPEEIC